MEFMSNFHLTSTRGLSMAVLFCTRKDVCVLPDRTRVLFELVRNFIKSASRFFPEMAFENCEWRSTLPDWPELDAVLGMPQGECPDKFKEVWQIFIQFLLECAKQGNRIKTKGRALELAVGQRHCDPVHLMLSPQKTLSFGNRRILAVIRGETLFPEWDVVDGLHLRRFHGLACFLTPAEDPSSTTGAPVPNHLTSSVADGAPSSRDSLREGEAPAEPIHRASSKSFLESANPARAEGAGVSARQGTPAYPPRPPEEITLENPECKQGG
jgi:hypothetical protein